MSKITNIPEKIFLQLGEGIEGNEDFNELSKTGEISWCHHKVFDSDIEYQLPKEIPDEVVYRTVKASDRKPIHLAHWNTDDGKDWSFPVIVDGEYGLGKFYDQRLVDEETPIYCIVVGVKDYYEDEFYKIEWLEPISLKDLLAK